MRSLCIFAVLSLIILVPVTSDVSDAADGTLRLYSVYPTEGFEGFAICNYGPQTDLKDHSVTDGEGTVSFTSSLLIGRYSVIFFCKSEPPGWLGFENVVVYGQQGVRMKGFALADSGDDVYLKRGDQLLDTFVYGDIKGVKDGWTGEPVQKITKKHMAVRNSFDDTDSAKDWKISVPGRTDFVSGKSFDAAVTPISFPNDHSALFSALQDSAESIDISVYLISHPRVVSSLLLSLSEGVSVRILIEGSPAGGTASSEIRALKTLQESGADVRVMKQTDGYRAYGYIHCKYAVIDLETTIITSENWLESSFDSNRGWGAVIRSPEYATYMENVFEADFERQYDVVPFDEVYPTAEKDSYEMYVMETSQSQSFEAKVTPVLSPDNSYDSMRKLICTAESRIYSEQLDVDYDWVLDDDNPIFWMKECEDVTDLRLIIDVTFDDRNDGDYRDGYGIMDALADSNISVNTPDFTGMVHNKGVIVDDSVWLGSVNWTYNSFRENREAAVIIESSLVADYFASLFLQDWGEKPSDVIDEEEFELSLEYQSNGNIFLFDAKGTGIDGCRFLWDIDGDGSYDREGRRIIAEMPYGPREVTLCVQKGDEQMIQTISVSSQFMAAVSPWH